MEKLAKFAGIKKSRHHSYTVKFIPLYPNWFREAVTRRSSLIKVFLIFYKLHMRTPVLKFFWGLQPAISLKRVTLTQVFPCESCKNFRTTGEKAKRFGWFLSKNFSSPKLQILLEESSHQELFRKNYFLKSRQNPWQILLKEFIELF